jgi:hypothetical protein
MNSIQPDEIDALSQYLAAQQIVGGGAGQ